MFERTISMRAVDQSGSRPAHLERRLARQRRRARFVLPCSIYAGAVLWGFAIFHVLNRSAL